MTARTLPAGYPVEIPAGQAGAETVRFLARCSRCKARHAVDVPARHTTTFWTLTANGFPNPDGRGTAYVRCGCGRALTMWKLLHGRTRPEVRCDARCTGAIGPSCDCSCGGRNHGTDHL